MCLVYTLHQFITRNRINIYFLQQKNNNKAPDVNLFIPEVPVIIWKLNSIAHGVEITLSVISRIKLPIHDFWHPEAIWGQKRIPKSSQFLADQNHSTWFSKHVLLWTRPHYFIRHVNCIKHRKHGGQTIWDRARQSSVRPFVKTKEHVPRLTATLVILLKALKGLRIDIRHHYWKLDCGYHASRNVSRDDNGSSGLNTIARSHDDSKFN